MRRRLRADTRVEELCNSLRQLAFERGPDAQLPTVSTLCKEFAVSSVTLTDALDRLEREQVLYRKRSLGIFVSPTIHCKSIYILFASAELISEDLSPFWALLWLRMEQEARRREAFKDEKYTFQLITPVADKYNSLSEDVLSTLQEKRVDAVLSVGLHTKGIEDASDPAIPYITFAGDGERLVIIDSHEEGRLAAGELIRSGCKKLACWMSHMVYFNIPGLDQREVPRLSIEEMGNFQGFREVISERKADFYPEFMRLPHLPLAHQALALQEQGYLLAKEVFGAPGDHKPDGLYIGNDLLADGALAAFEELGVQVGKDLKVVAHGNTGSPILFGHLRHITVIEINPNDIAQAMFSLLDTVLAGNKATDQIIWIRPRLR